MALWTGILDLPFLVCRHMYSARRDPQVLAAFILGRVMLCSYSDGSAREGQGSFPGSSSTRGGERRRAFQEDADSTEMEGRERSLPVGVAHIFPHPCHNQHTHTLTICTGTQNKSESETVWLRSGLEPLARTQTQPDPWSPTAITHLASALNGAEVLDVSSQQELCEKQSGR